MTLQHRVPSVAVFILALLMLAAEAATAEPQPHWIWSPEQAATDGAVRVSKRFRTASTTSSMNLRFATVSARLKILLDGEVIATADPYDPLRTIELNDRLSGGDHEIVVQASGVTGPSAFFLQLELKFGDVSRELIVSNSEWRVVGGGLVKNLGLVDRRLTVPHHRGIGIDVVDDYEQWKQALGVKNGTDPATFQLAPDFEIRLVRSALPDEGSWVSLVFDSQGRPIIAKEQRGLLRMTLSSDGREVTKSESIEDTLEECRGLAFIGNDLYVNANNSKGLYRLRCDADRFTEPELLYASSGGVGHGRNDLAVGPDGKLYAIQGDAVDLPKDVVDYTSPFRDARRGKKTSEGHLLRIDPESGSVEVLAAGLRNPFGIDFNADGECFTYDADAEFDMGAPWYRPTRVNHLVTGGDYGWRGVTSSWPPYYPDHPDNARPNLDIGKGSPTAVKFGTRSNFPTPYREGLFVLDWAYGRIIVVHMIPRGSSYLMTGETFLKGRPLNVTDLDFAPDGSMYFITGGRKTQSALYRVQFVGKAAAKATATPYEAALEEFAKSARRLRRELEAELRQPPSEASIDGIWKHLSNPDPWIRHAAVNIIERHPTSIWQSRAMTESEITPAVQALTALARARQPDLYPVLLRRLNEILPHVESSPDKLSAFYAYWLCLETLDVTDDQLRTTTVSRLDAEYPSRSNAESSYAHNRLLSELLVKLEARDAVAKTIGLLNTTADQAEQMHYLYVLRNARTGWKIDDRRTFFFQLGQGTHYLGGAGMSGFLEKIRAEAMATLADEHREQLEAATEGRPPTNETIEKPSRPLVRKWSVEELLSPESANRPSDRLRGAEVFAEASCIHCHRFGNRGTPIGPDLTSVSRRFSRRDLLASMIEPSRVIAENYRSLHIVTFDGKSYIGQPVLGGDFRSPLLRLATNPMQPFITVDIPKKDIELQKQSNVSWMPTGLLDTFSEGEILGLLAFLEAAP